MTVATAHRVLLRRSMRGIWPHLPLLTLGSAAVCACACLAALIAPGVTPPALVLSAILVAPSVTALAAIANTVVGQDDSDIRWWLAAWSVGVRRGIPAVLLPAVAGALLLVAVQVWQHTGAPVVLVSVGVSGAVTAGLVPLSVAVLHTTCALPERTALGQWRTAAELLVRWPVRFLAAPVLLGLGVWAATQLSVSLLLLVPAPVTLVGAAALWTSAVETGDLIVEDLTENDLLERESA
ncbi:hypothetical protein [Flexivirga sp. B27]